MKTLEDEITTTTTAPVQWRTAQAGLWIASSDGRPVGIVTERWTRGFVVTAASGRDLGRHTSLEAAKTALEESVA
jgi:hypothetical protein